MSYNWLDGYVIYNNTNVSEVATQDGGYVATIAGVDTTRYSSIRSIISTPTQGTYTHEYCIDSIVTQNATNKAFVFVLEIIEDDGTTTGLLTTGLDGALFCNLYVFGNVSHGIPVSINAGDKISICVKFNTNTGDYIYAGRINDVDILNFSGTSTTVVGDISNKKIKEERTYIGDNVVTISDCSSTMLGFTPDDGTHHIYVDLESTTSGNGSTANPLTYIQFNEYIENNIGNPSSSQYHSYVINIRGSIEVPSNSPNIFSSPNSRQVPTNIIIRGWDVGVHGSPLLKLTYNGDTWAACEKNGLWGSNYVINGPTNSTNSSTIVQDIIIQSTYGYQTQLDLSTTTYKNVMFIIGSKFNTAGHNTANLSEYENAHINYFGCTFSSPIVVINSLAYVDIRDSIFDTPDISIGEPERQTTGVWQYPPANKLIMNNNTANTDTVTFYDTDYPYGTYDFSEYVKPIYNRAILTIPKTLAFTQMVSYVSDRSLMSYERYNIHEFLDTSIVTFRNDNDYNHGLFNYNRKASGAYSMYTPTDVGIAYPTSGHVGSFYFDGDYTNASPIFDPTGLTIDVGYKSYVSIDVNTQTDVPDLEITFPNKPDGFAKGEINFFVDFVGKKRSDEHYPKYCGIIEQILGDVDQSKCSVCTTGFEREQYNTPVRGDNTLVVDFSACTIVNGSVFSGYKAIEYNWYFDYEHEPTTVVTCAGPYAEHAYCGGYLDEYDVRLCVTFR